MSSLRSVQNTSRGRFLGSGHLSSVVAAMVVLIGTMAAGGLVRPAAIRAQTTSTATASVAPADAPMFVAFSIDMTSTQWSGAEALLRQIGLGDAVDEFLTEFRIELVGELGPDGPDLLTGSEFGLVFSDVSAVFGSDDVSSADEGSGLASIISAPRGAAEIYAAMQRSMEETAADDGTTVARSTYNGVTILAVPDDQAIARFDDATRMNSRGLRRSGSMK